MALKGAVQAADDGAIGFDTAVPLRDAAAAEAFAKRGYKYCIRYVSRTDKSRDNNQKNGLADLSELEAGLILASGMALMVVQHVAATGWVPSEALGGSYGECAARFSAAAGVPPGVNVWLDLEDIPRGTPHEDIIAYANAWYDKVYTAGFVPGVYIGFNVWLTPDELFFDLKFRHYWRAAGDIVEVGHRGYQMFQHILNPRTPQALDKNVTRADALGDRAQWLAP